MTCGVEGMRRVRVCGHVKGATVHSNVARAHKNGRLE